MTGWLTGCVDWMADWLAAVSYAKQLVKRRKNERRGGLKVPDDEDSEGAHYDAVQYSTVQYSTVQYSTLQYSGWKYPTVLGCQMPLLSTEWQQ